MKTKIILFASLAFASILFFACKKESGTAPIQILLTDKPADYDSVNVHIVGMEVKISKDGESWIPINVKDSIYNLLDLQKGITAVLAQDTVPVGVLQEVRFILGSDCYIVKGGTVYPMDTPSAEDSGLKVKINKALNTTLNTFILDFVADLSVQEENGAYKLRPVIQLKP
jgi:uncharacterized protein DUF4382